MGRYAYIAQLALVAALTYMMSWDQDLPLWLDAAWKGSAVALLAFYAAQNFAQIDGKLITAVLALGAGGDILLEVAGLQVGALSFLIGHLVAIWLYVRNRRDGWRRWAPLAVVFVAAVVALAWTLPPDPAARPGIALYTTGLAAMAAAAWFSTFLRKYVALGALMFVVSDLFLFARMGALRDAYWVNGAVWGFYIGGQYLIAVGVTQALSLRQVALGQNIAPQ